MKYFWRARGANPRKKFKCFLRSIHPSIHPKGAKKGCCFTPCHLANFLLVWPTRTDPTKSSRETGKPTFLDPGDMTWGGPFWRPHQKEIWHCHLFVFSCLTICLSIDLSMHLSIYPSTHLSSCPSIHLFVCPSTNLSIYPCI